MTDPDPLNPAEAPSLISVGTQALVDNAKRLGLNWILRMATVRNVTASGIVAQYDGDDTEITMVSMMGPLTVAERVYAIAVPPSGNFIVGMVNQRHGIHTGETGSVVLTFVTQTSVTQAVVFDRPFQDTPIVLTNINSGSGPTTNWISRAFNITVNGFTLWVSTAGAATSWTSVAVQWAAFSRLTP